MDSSSQTFATFFASLLWPDHLLPALEQETGIKGRNSKQWEEEGEARINITLI